MRILRARQPDSDWLAHAHWSRTGRHSFSAKDRDVVIETDVITSAQPFDGIEVRADNVRFDLLALATPSRNAASISRGATPELDVPAYSQYHGDERGWCSATSLAMIDAYYGRDGDVPETARAVFDSAYNGTGNWSFNVAYSGSLGLAATVAYLRNLDHAAQFIREGIPLALSYSWKGNELPGAPVEHSDGHLVVLRGFTAAGDCIVNDPAAPGVRVVYEREAIERIWLRNKGIAYVIAEPATDIERLINT
ncbi:MAG: C39 family peptidase [Candidatus Eremiobacteraeota bacterium]|nr:C39 family peptidase [Candidatus Eremiobacteraeota bacterium]